MIIKLSDTIFTSSGHLLWGIPNDVPAKMPEETLPIPEKPGPFEWPTNWPKCRGLSNFSFDLNGLERDAWICDSALHAKRSSNAHGDVYTDIVTQSWNTLKNEPAIDLWCGGTHRAHSLLVFEECVTEWGYGNRLLNTIKTSDFIKLVVAGRGQGMYSWKSHCEVLLTMMGVSPTDDPLTKARDLFSSPKTISALLKMVANETQKTEHEQRRHYTKTKWNLQTKSTSITC